MLQLRDLGLGLLERDVLDEDRLRENVNRVGIVGQLLVEQGFGVGIFFLQLCLVYPLCERVQKLFFLGSHLGPTSDSRRLIAFAASQD